MSDFTQLGITLTSPERAVFLLVCATIGEVHAAVTGDKPDKSNVFKPYKLPSGDLPAYEAIKVCQWGFDLATVSDLIKMVRDHQGAFAATAKVVEGGCNTQPNCSLQFHSKVLPVLVPHLHGLREGGH